jgi:tetratricopeptide (TPR) repeat protein
MSHGDHPSRELLQRFLLQELDEPQTATVLNHLLAGCGVCSAELGELFQPPQGRYSFAIAQARAANQDHLAALARARTEVHLRFAGAACQVDQPPMADLERRPYHAWAWCELLLEVADRLRSENLHRAVDFAMLATLIADRLAGPFPLATLADMRARAWAELGNLERAADYLECAEESLETALDHLAAGTGDDLLFARILDIHGSLFRAQRRFGEAVRALDRASRLYLEKSERHRAGRVLIKKGLALIYAEQPGEALEALERAFTYLDLSHDKALVLSAVHNSLIALVDSAHHERAARLLWRCRPLYQAHASPLDRVRLLGLEAKVAAGLGQPVRAEQLFRDEKTGFEDAGLAYDSALVGLDLAALLIEQGRPAEVIVLVDQMLGSFYERGILREAFASLLILRKAVEQGEATVVLVRTLTEELKKIDRASKDG